MPKLYAVINSPEEKTYNILEKNTGIIINVRDSSSKESVDKMCKKLNSGHGFSGFTPEFIAKKFKLKGISL